MNAKDFEIKIIKNWNLDEIVELYKAGNWWKEHYKKQALTKLIKGSFVFAILLNKKTGKAIGMGRIISDGVSDAYLQDLIILSEFRGLGLGKQLVNELVGYCYNNGIKWIALISEPNQDGFYKKIGFKKMINYIPMKFKE